MEQRKVLIQEPVGRKYPYLFIKNHPIITKDKQGFCFITENNFNKPIIRSS